MCDENSGCTEKDIAYDPDKSETAQNTNDEAIQIYGTADIRGFIFKDSVCLDQNVKPAPIVPPTPPNPDPTPVPPGPDPNNSSNDTEIHVMNSTEDIFDSEE